MTASPHSRTPSSSAPEEWLSLTELGKAYGISAIHTGKVLTAAGLRLDSGEPSARALKAGLALAGSQLPSAHRQSPRWHRTGCGHHLESQGLVPQRQRNLVGLWADLLSALHLGCPSVQMSPEEMAEEMPGELVSPVNQELSRRGCSFRVRLPLRKAARPRPACSPSPAAPAADPHPYG
jgi:hypothetical protein